MWRSLFCLGPGDQVTVHEREKLPHEAVVDVLTEDALVIWVVAVHGGSRRVFHYSDDVELAVAGDRRAAKGRQYKLA